MAANSNGSYGVQIIGINPTDEKKLTSISDKLVEGTYLKKFTRSSTRGPGIRIDKKSFIS